MHFRVSPIKLLTQVRENLFKINNVSVLIYKMASFVCNLNRTVYCCLLLFMFELWITAPIRGFAIDNEISGIPEIQCSEDAITFTVRTRNPFAGNIYIKSKFHDPNCRKEFFVNTAAGASLAVRIPQCSMQRIRQLQPQGMNYILVFVVTFHPQFVTKIDRAYNVRCFYAQQEKTVSSSLEVSMLSTQSLEIGIIIMPNCLYTVRSNTLNGPPVRFVRIGDRLVHRWECDNPNFGMLIKNCFVNDGYGSSVRVIDAKGCPVLTPVIQGPLQYDNNLNLAYVEVWAYKFPDRGDLFFECQIQVCNKFENECVGLTPPNCPSNRPQPTPSSLIETQAPSFTVVYPQPIIDQTIGGNRPDTVRTAVYPQAIVDPTVSVGRPDPFRTSVYPQPIVDPVIGVGRPSSFRTDFYPQSVIDQTFGGNRPDSARYPQTIVDPTFGPGRSDSFASYQVTAPAQVYIQSKATLPSAPATGERNWYPRGPELQEVAPLDAQLDRKEGTKIIAPPALPPQQSRRNQPPAIQLAFTVADNEENLHVHTLSREFVTPRVFTLANNGKPYGRREGRKKRRIIPDKADKTMDVASGVVYVAEVGDFDDDESTYPFGLKSANDYEYLICLTPVTLSILLGCFMILAIIVLLLCLYLCAKSERFRKRSPTLRSLSSPLY